MCADADVHRDRRGLTLSLPVTLPFYRYLQCQVILDNIMYK